MPSGIWDWSLGYWAHHIFLLLLELLNGIPALGIPKRKGCRFCDVVSVHRSVIFAEPWNRPGSAIAESCKGQVAFQERTRVVMFYWRFYALIDPHFGERVCGLTQGQSMVITEYPAGWLVGDYRKAYWILCSVFTYFSISCLNMHHIHNIMQKTEICCSLGNNCKHLR